MSNLSVGFAGEQLAVEYLQSLHFTVLERNVRNRFGEIDIVASKDSKLYFIEVKARTSSFCGKPYDNVHELKLKRLTRAIQCYILERNLHAHKFELDVIAVEYVPGDKPKIRRYENIPLTVY